MPSARAVNWLNGSNLPGEADFANVQFPTTLNVQASQPTGFIFGQLYEAGLTEAAGAPANVLAELGYGPAASDPLANIGWAWFPASYNVQVGNNDEYSANITAPAAAGSYLYTYRYSLDNGANWTAGDVDGAGSNAGLAYDPLMLGVMTVTTQPTNDIDYGALQFPPTLNLPAGQFTGPIYGQVYEAGVTEAAGPPPGITASLGFGPAGTDPRTSAKWSWTDANYNVQVGNNDEFQVGFTTPAVNGSYRYTYRYSLNGGTNWTVADLDGVGTNSGLSFDLNQLGVLTVTGGVNPVLNPADFDKDFDVDKIDLTEWIMSLGVNNGADADVDGDSDGDDFLRWQRELGAMGIATAAAQGVAEPASGALAAVGLGLLAALRRKPSHRAG